MVYSALLSGYFSSVNYTSNNWFKGQHRENKMKYTFWGDVLRALKTKLKRVWNECATSSAWDMPPSNIAIKWLGMILKCIDRAIMIMNKSMSSSVYTRCNSNAMSVLLFKGGGSWLRPQISLFALCTHTCKACVSPQESSNYIFRIAKGKKLYDSHRMLLCGYVRVCLF